MTTAADTFTAFVDALADALDEHDTTAEELASRLRLSRFHFDRLVSQVAGEPPRAFRRRILLERAACRLLATHHSVIDAFRRARRELALVLRRRAHGVTQAYW